MFKAIFTSCISLVLLFCGPIIYAQDLSGNKEIITLEEIFEIALTSNQEVRIEDKFVKINNRAFDNKMGLVKYFSEKYPESMDSLGNLNVNRRLIITNCEFEDNLYFHKINFSKLLVISKCRLRNLNISNSKSARIRLDKNKVLRAIELYHVETSKLGITNNKPNRNLLVDECNVKTNLVIKKNTVNNGNIQLMNSNLTFGSVLMAENVALAEIVEGCKFQLGSSGEFNHFEKPGSIPGDLNFIGNIIDGDSTTRVIFNKANYLNLNIQNNIFKSNVYFIENKANERLILVDNVFEGFVSFDKFLFSEIWNELYWEQLEGYKLRFKDYAAVESSDFDQKREFRNLINIYKSMHTIFLSRGDLKSANACYSEMKELQGKMLRHIYLKDSTFDNFLRWQLNVLLKIYTNHGTDPGLAVVVSFYVIVLFSLFYIFYPSEWDSQSRAKMIQAFKNFRNPNGKTIVNSLGVISFALLITLINAITLSINSFVTLGFGSIPTQGFGRYICVIEGFIGWFLLSIFSVSLINQVLA